jgi:hypothetical protein
MELRNENVSFYVQLKIPVPLRVGFVMCCYIFLANSLLPLCSPVATVDELCFSRHRRASADYPYSPGRFAIDNDV